MTRRSWLSVLVVAVPRLAVFPFNENLYGDAIARTWLAHVWLASPHLIGGFDQGALQFGPLHLYLLALAEWLWPSLLHAGRVVSLLSGIATVVPLERLSRRLFGERAASWAVFGFAFWGMHIQCSTTSASEAVNLLFVVWALERFSAWHENPDRRAALMAAALLLNLACATRYDAWLLVPLLVLAVGLKARSLRTMAWFAALSGTFAVAWLCGNFLDRGTPFYPLTYIDDFHRQWFPSEEARWGPWRYRLMCLFFWPGSAVVTLTPLVALGGLWGLWRAWHKGRGRWLVAIVVLPALAYTFRSAVLASFVPLSRFTVKEVALLLPFVWVGATDLFRRWPRLERPLVPAAGAALVGFSLWLGAFTFRSDGRFENSLRPISPTSTNEQRLMTVARWLAERPDESGSIVVDEDPSGYDDMIVSYYTGYPYERQARRRSPWFERRLAQAPPVFLVRWEGGRLEREGRLRIDGSTALLDSIPFEEIEGFEPPLHVLRRVERPHPRGEMVGAE